MSTSINMINNCVYKIPKILDDALRIEEFLNKNAGKKIVVVQGLGFVGAVMSLVCANAHGEEYAVIGIDLPTPNSFWKIESINDGVFPVVAEDKNIEKLFQNSIAKGNFIATYDNSAYKAADFVIIDINLDVKKESASNYSLVDYDVDMSSFESSVATIAQNCRSDVTILVETTVPPGTCQNIVKPIIDSEFTKRLLPIDDYHLGHSYERVMPGPDYIDSIINYPRVYSGISESSSDKIESFLKTIIDTSRCELTRLKNTNESEIAKVLENSYRAMNISFMVEWSRFAEEIEIDIYSVVNAIRARPSHKNLMYPGVGVGGYCLTKDPLLANWSRNNIFNGSKDLDFTVQSVSINDQMPRFAFNRLLEVYGEIRNKRLAFLGVSYRGDVGDTRFSPVENLYTMAHDAGGILFAHDYFIHFWSEKNLSVTLDLNHLKDFTPDIIIMSAGHTEYTSSSSLDLFMKLKSCFIFDTIGLFNNEQIAELKKKHRVSVLGRGDV